MLKEEQEHLEKIFGKDIQEWYVGMDNTVDAGFAHLLRHLDKHGEILVDVIGVFDYSYYEQISYAILYRALPKLEYLEYKYNEKVDKNQNSKKV